LRDSQPQADLYRGLLQNLGAFLTGLGRDFCYSGPENPVLAGGQNFALDPLFLTRARTAWWPSS
jgi:hypothetical protein